jgi:hypothetical protein
MRCVVLGCLLFCGTPAFGSMPEINSRIDSAGDTTVVSRSESPRPVIELVADVPKDSAALDGSIVAPQASSELKWYTMFERIPGDWVTYGKLTFRKEKIPAILAMAALTGALIVADQPLWRFSDEFYKSNKTTEKVSEFFEYLGDGKPQFGLAGAFAAYGFVFKDERALRTGSQIVEVIFGCGTVIQVLKHMTGRESPFVSSRTNGRWVFFPNQIEYHKKVPYYDAFPSGHIATAMATLTVVMENYPEIKPWFKPIAYTIVGLIGVGLGNTGIHWYSDFPLGIALGYQFGMIASHPEGFEVAGGGDPQSSKLTFLPNITPSGTGVTVAFQF